MRFQFGNVVVDEAARQVMRGGSAVHVSPKAFDLLVALVRERPRVLSKEDLHARLWPTTFVSDTSLAALVAELRAALGESARQPQWIRTVHRRGYAFQADSNDRPASAPASAAAVATRESTSGFWLMAPAGQITLLAGDNLVGREPGARVWLESPSVSRRHARLRVEGPSVTLEDLGSKNGTFVRDVAVTARTLLQDGDPLRFGSVGVTFRTWAADPTLTDGGA